MLSERSDDLLLDWESLGEMALFLRYNFGGVFGSGYVLINAVAAACHREKSSLFVGLEKQELRQRLIDGAVKGEQRKVGDKDNGLSTRVSWIVYLPKNFRVSRTFTAGG